MPTSREDYIIYMATSYNAKPVISAPPGDKPFDNVLIEGDYRRWKFVSTLIARHKYLAKVAST
jgi:hypothetical protein